MRRRRARHFSVWTFVAPAALIVAVVVVVSVVTSALDAREKDKQDKARTAAVAAAAQKTTTTPKKAVKARYHRVKNGESFSSIADHFKTTVDALTALNPNVDPLKLTPGARIRVQ